MQICIPFVRSDVVSIFASRQRPGQSECCVRPVSFGTTNHALCRCAPSRGQRATPNGREVQKASDADC